MFDDKVTMLLGGSSTMLGAGEESVPQTGDNSWERVLAERLRQSHFLLDGKPT